MAASTQHHFVAGLPAAQYGCVDAAPLRCWTSRQAILACLLKGRELTETASVFFPTALIELTFENTRRAGLSRRDGRRQVQRNLERERHPSRQGLLTVQATPLRYTLLSFDCPRGQSKSGGQSKLSNEGLRSDLNARHTASFGNGGLR